MDISKIDGVGEPVLNQPRQEDQRQRQAKEIRKGDKVNISPEAKEAAVLAKLVALAKEMPEVRDDKVAQAKARLESQTQQADEVNRTTAQRLLEDLL